MVISDEPLLWVVSTASEWSLSKTTSQPAPSLVPRFHATSPGQLCPALWTCRVAWFVYCGARFPWFLPRAFFRPLLLYVGYSATRIFRSKLKGKGKNFMTKHQPSWLASASPFFLLSLLPLSLSLPVCMSFASSIQCTVYRNVFVAVWDCLGSSSESLNCGVSLWYIVRYGSAIYELHWREGHCFNP